MAAKLEEVIDWHRLLELRNSFLEGSAGRRDYWTESALLRDYDVTFGQRIGWKWRWVLQDLKRRPWSPPPGPVLDWACGTGIAGREFASTFRLDALLFHDRSMLAVRFAQNAMRQEFPVLSLTAENKPTTLLVSHVLSELDEAGLASLIHQVRAATACVWVEPGTFELSRQLLEVRDKLLEDGFFAVSPCPHQERCGLLAPNQERHWCHHFAPPPPEAFTSSFWAYFSRSMGVDLRALPVSYLVMDRRPPPELPVNTVRLLGRPRIYKPYATLQGCQSSGVHERQLAKRRHPHIFREIRHHAPFSLQTWTIGDKEVEDFGGLGSDAPHDAAADEIQGGL